MSNLQGTSVLLEMEMEAFGFKTEVARFAVTLCTIVKKYNRAFKRYFSAFDLLREGSISFDGLAKLLSYELSEMEQATKSYNMLAAPRGYKTIYRRISREMKVCYTFAFLAQRDYGEGCTVSAVDSLITAARACQSANDRLIEVFHSWLDRVSMEV
ncbi:hypothetical protein [Paenibacillus sp. SI8]|uniref:hypothetical protein n=1 Tax=unclassified Paenibacillus TaxID=185978 RepID=UPI003466F850